MKEKYLKLKNKIEDHIIEVLESVSNIANEMKMEYFVVGATARDIIFTYVYSIATGLATKDIDLGVCLATWDAYDAFVERLCSEKEFTPTDVKHKFLYKGFPVDMIPFGGIANADKLIKWPEEKDREMNLTGFEEAYQDAIIIQLRDDPLLEIPVVSPRGYAILKLISWNDRKDQTKKDAQDLLLVIKNYAYLGNDERIYEIEEIFDQEDFDYIEGSATLLGYDIATIANEKTLRKVIEILEADISGTTDYRLVQDMFTLDIDNIDQFESNMKLLHAVKKGCDLK
jgi:predicted nucleotidyltransferase